MEATPNRGTLKRGIMINCHECGKPFTRYDNMQRHKMQAHPHLFEKNEDVEDGEIVDKDKQNETDDGSESSSESQDDRGSESDSESEDDSGSEAEDENKDDDAQSYNLWKYLFEVASNAPGIKAQWEDAKERLANPELSDEELDGQAGFVMTNIFKC